MNPATTTNSEVLFIEIWIFKLIRSQRVVIEFRVVIEMLLKRGNSLFQLINLLNCARRVRRNESTELSSA